MERTVALDAVAWGQIARWLARFEPRYGDLQQRILQAIAQADAACIGTQAAMPPGRPRSPGGDVLVGRAGQELLIPLTLNDEEFALAEALTSELEIPMATFA